MSGIHVDSWVRIEGQCDITCEIIGDEAQFQFGGTFSSGLNMIVTEEALRKLVHASRDALRRMNVELDDHDRTDNRIV